jgi:hypothetical protein
MHGKSRPAPGVGASHPRYMHLPQVSRERRERVQNESAVMAGNDSLVVGPEGGPGLRLVQPSAPVPRCLVGGIRHGRDHEVPAMAQSDELTLADQPSEVLRREPGRSASEARNTPCESASACHSSIPTGSAGLVTRI